MSLSWAAGAGGPEQQQVQDLTMWVVEEMTRLPNAEAVGLVGVGLEVGLKAGPLGILTVKKRVHQLGMMLALVLV